jgi:hypothetical protein
MKTKLIKKKAIAVFITICFLSVLGIKAQVADSSGNNQEIFADPSNWVGNIASQSPLITDFPSLKTKLN